METYLVAHIATNKSKLQIILTYNAGQLRPMWRAKQFSSHITSSLCVSVLLSRHIGTDTGLPDLKPVRGTDSCHYMSLQHAYRSLAFHLSGWSSTAQYLAGFEYHQT